MENALKTHLIIAFEQTAYIKGYKSPFDQLIYDSRH